ncbi:UbiA prenyltransferase [Cristinia sonorae]|uniref:UbiA prenyltransferase n=1 Tax=Cristinia sonorae TaxID=1940300 RepID=A0A8K0XKL0_9AGAR|nr:UbiA prenyltransferase [Cristinia sonorae]
MSVEPYLELIRLRKPAGFALFLWPSVWGIGMAAYANKTPLDVVFVLLLKAVAGAFIIRGAACTVNDIFDRDFDAAVERTRNRPLASGRVSVPAATIYLFIQYAAGVAFFTTYNDPLVFWVSVVDLIPLLAIYPLIKRVSYWPQAWLAISMNILFAQSWFQIDNTFPGYSNVVYLMTLGGCLYVCLSPIYSASRRADEIWDGQSNSWTLMYDTVYGCQDRKDDVEVGIYSTSLLFGKWVWEITAALDVAIVVCLALAGMSNGHGLPYFVVSVGGAAVQMMYQLNVLDVDSPESCWDNFKQNAFYLGPLILVGIMMDYTLAIWKL